MFTQQANFIIALLTEIHCRLGNDPRTNGLFDRTFDHIFGLPEGTLFTEIGNLTNDTICIIIGKIFVEAPAWDEFPCLGLAFRALQADRSLPIVLNASNEVAVASFLEGKLAFTAIPEVIAATMDAHTAWPVDTLAAVRAVDAWAHAHARDLVRGLESRER